MRHQQRVKNPKMFSCLILMAALAGPVHAAPQTTVADRAVALVDNEIVTASDLKLHLSLGAHDESFVPVLRADPETLLDDAISATLIRSIGGRISVYQPNPAQVRSRLAMYRDKWPSVDVWETHLLSLGLDQQRLYRAIERRLVIERVVSRVVGQPGDDMTLWTTRFDSWLEQERARVRVRKVAPMSTEAAP